MVKINGSSLTLEEIVNISRKNEMVEMDPSCLPRIQESAQAVAKLQHSDKPAYGINTGFGIFSTKKISAEDSKKLNRNLIISHAVGCGESFPVDVVRAAMLIRANSLVKGFSGVRVEIITTLLEMINKQLTPLVKEKGSLGSSGDLCMLAQMAMVFTMDGADSELESGLVFYQGEFYSGKQAMKIANIPRLELSAKEGLAIINGASFSAAIAALAVYDAEYCMQKANLSASLSLEVLLGKSAAFDPRLQEARGLTGQISVAREILLNVKGSNLVDSANQIQDPYSFRCIPQVHGPILDTIESVKKIITEEVNAATDNPLIFDGDVVSGGNFHGEPIALNMDFLAIAMTELSAMAERRLFILLDENMNNGLPPMLVGSVNNAGIHSGVMIPQYTAASLVLENRVLATPDSVQSLPTSANQEDFNANALTAAKHAYEIIRNSFFIVAIEMFISARAMDLRKIQNSKYSLGKETGNLYKMIRSKIPFHPEDSLWNDEIESIYQDLSNRKY
jgi:histidine ammonia-lyase